MLELWFRRRRTQMDSDAPALDDSVAGKEMTGGERRATVSRSGAL